MDELDLPPIILWIFLAVAAFFVVVMIFTPTNNDPCAELTGCAVLKCQGEQEHHIGVSNNYYLRYQACLLEQQIPKENK